MDICALKPSLGAIQDCVASAKAVAEAMGIPSDAVLIESTGVIGRRIKCAAAPAALR